MRSSSRRRKRVLWNRSPSTSTTTWVPGEWTLPTVLRQPAGQGNYAVVGLTPVESLTGPGTHNRADAARIWMAAEAIAPARCTAGVHFSPGPSPASHTAAGARRSDAT